LQKTKALLICNYCHLNGIHDCYAVASLPLFRASAYQSLIGKVESGDKISNHIAPISIDEIRVVDEVWRIY
jgi:hypothetical protein